MPKAKKKLTLFELIKIADEAYSDGLIMAYHMERDGNHGDGLAKFIAIELAETFDQHTSRMEQLSEASRVMHNAATELACVQQALFEAE